MSDHRPTRLRALAALLLAALAALAISACGGSSGSAGSGSSATTLLKQTFSGEHKVNSGNITFALSVDPSGSTSFTQPITLAFGGPFQSRGKGQLPASDFAVSINAQGHTGSLSIISTGTKGYVSLSGTSYQLPAADFQRLESSFSSIAGSGSSSGAKSGTLARLGINPLTWLNDPTIVGQESIGGAPTTHITAKVDVPALLRDLNTFLGKASSLGVAGTGQLPSTLSAAEQQKIAAEVQHPTFDVWTGNSDHTVRRLVVGLTLPVSGQLSTLLGGMKSAGLKLTLGYRDLNQPQTISAPTSVQPYSQFQAKLATLVQEIEGSLASGALGGSGATGSSGAGGAGSSGSGSTTTGAAGATSAYSQCITAAAGDVNKMQQCASLLSGQG